MMSNRALALTATPSSKIICNNVKAIQKGKHSLPVKTLKRSGELYHTILEPHEILNTLQETMLTVDSREWHGPVTVLGQDR